MTLYSIQAFDLDDVIAATKPLYPSRKPTATANTVGGVAGIIIPGGDDVKEPESWARLTYLTNEQYEILRPNMAMKFPFELDVFQKQAVMRLERRECVFVAGKIIVILYTYI
jgi:hypothetical protein